MLLKYHTFGNELLCHLLSVWPNPRNSCYFLTLRFIMFLHLSLALFVSFNFSLPYSVTHMHTHVHTCTLFPSFHLSLVPWCCFPPWGNVGLYHGHLTRLPETTKKGRVLIGVTDRWKTGSVEIRDPCDANKTCIQWLLSFLRAHCFLALQLELGKELLCIIALHTNTYLAFFGSGLSWAGGLWDYSNQLLTKGVNNTSKYKKKRHLQRDTQTPKKKKVQFK